MAPPLTEGAVLQRGAPITVLGTADPGEGLLVTLGDARRVARADGEGRWTATFAPSAADAFPRALSVRAADGEALRVPGLLIGDVWIAAGQSNMAWATQLDAADNGVLRRALMDPTLRLYREPPRCADGPEPAAGQWTGSEWDDAKTFSAIGYHFGRALAAETGVPVGIVQAARGGSPIDAWVPTDRLDAPGFGDAPARRRAAERAVAEGRRAFAEAMLSWLTAYADEPEDAHAPPPWPSDADWRHVPGCYWDGMLAGLTGTPVAGMLWYQGESDATRGGAGYAQRLEVFLGAVRAAWGDDLPILVFGLPPYEGEPATARVRRAQEAVAARDGATVLVPSEAPGHDPLELHPREKREPARRAAAMAAASAASRQAATAPPGGMSN